MPHGVEIGGKLHAGGEEALALFSLTLPVELLPPLGEKAHGGLIGGQNFHRLARCVQGVAGGGILPGGVVRARLSKGLHGRPGPRHQGLNVHTGSGNGQQAHRGEHRVAPPHRVGDHEGLIALGVGQPLEGSLVGVGGGVDPPAGPLLAVLLLQQGFENAEGHGGLGGGARFGDDIDREVLVLDQRDGLQQGVGGQPVAGEVDGRPFGTGEVKIGGVQSLHHGPGAQIGPPDSDDHQGLGVGADFAGGGLDARELLMVVVMGQADPAGKLPAGAVALGEHIPGPLQGAGPAGEPVVGEEGDGVGKIDMNHNSCLLRGCPYGISPTYCL